MAKSTKDKTEKIVKKKEPKEPVTQTAYTPEQSPEFDPDMPLNKQRHLIR